MRLPAGEPQGAGGAGLGKAAGLAGYRDLVGLAFLVCPMVPALHLFRIGTFVAERLVFLSSFGFSVLIASLAQALGPRAEDKGAAERRWFVLERPRRDTNGGSARSVAANDLVIGAGCWGVTEAATGQVALSPQVLKAQRDPRPQARSVIGADDGGVARALLGSRGSVTGLIAAATGWWLRVRWWVAVVVVAVAGAGRVRNNASWQSEETLLEASLQTCPRSAKLLFAKGMSLYRFAQWDLALSAFGQALHVLPDYDNVHYYLAKLLLSPCISVASPWAMHSLPTSSSVNTSQTSTEGKTGWQHMQAALARQPFRDVFNREASLFLAHQGEAAAALKHFQRLAARVKGDYRPTPSLPPPPPSLAEALDYIAAWSRQDKDVTYLISLAAALSKVGRHAQAADIYSRALDALGQPRWGDHHQLSTLACVNARRTLERQSQERAAQERRSEAS